MTDVMVDSSPIEQTYLMGALVRKAALGWMIGGVLLGLIQVLAVGLHKPLGVSTQFVVADSMVLHQVAPNYAAQHPLISKEKYRQFGYGWWFDIGLILGAALAALFARRWRLSVLPVWWEVNKGPAKTARLINCFIGGFLILLGSRFAHGCTSGQFVSGWAQLAVAVIPFTLTLFGFALITARWIYPKTPEIES